MAGYDRHRGIGRLTGIHSRVCRENASTVVGSRKTRQSRRGRLPDLVGQARSGSREQIIDLDDRADRGKGDSITGVIFAITTSSLFTDLLG